MKWYIKAHSIVLNLHFALILGMLVLVDYFLFANLLQLFELRLLLLIFAFLSGMGILFSLNSILSILNTVQQRAQCSDFAYLLFAQLFITMIAGFLMTVPGITTSLMGWVLYFKPIRIIVSRLVYKYKKQSIMRLYSYFLAEYISTSNKQ